MSLLIMIGIWIGQVIVQGWILAIMWKWFVIPTFHLPALSIPAAMGLTLIVAMLWNPKFGDEKDIVNQIWVSYAIPVVCLIFGWLIHSLV
jgi:hypothetical protein